MSASTLKRLDPTQVELELSIPPEEFDAAQDAAFRRLVRNVRVPGFRPGKVPRAVFERQYGTAQIVDGALEEIVPKAYAAAVEEHHLDPLERPKMELLPPEGEAEHAPLRVKAVVAVRPEFDLQPYTGVAVEEQSESADEADVERALETMRRDAATLVPVERPAQLGDVVTMDYTGKIDGVAFDGGTAQGEQTELRPERFVPGFVEGIVGMNAGETKDVTAHFPAEYGNAELAGKEAVFTIVVHEIKEPELPPLDDEFAKRVSRSEDLAALRAEVKRRLDEIARQKARRAMGEALIARLLERNDVPLPQVLVEREMGSIEDDARRYVGRAGVAWDAYLAESGKDEATVREGFRSEAERRVKTTLVVEAIARAEGIEATREDVENELAALSAQYGQPREKILELLRNDVSTIVDGIVRTKTLDWLIDRAERVPATGASAG